MAQLRKSRSDVAVEKKAYKCLECLDLLASAI
jgi:DNA-binding winged helix-turn-helix (wHTH) protein